MLLDGGVGVAPSTLLYIGPGCACWALPPLLWWNFVGREPAEMTVWAQDWAREDGGRFGSVKGYAGPRIPVPPVPALRRPG